MYNLWIDMGTIIEFIGTLIIMAYIIHAVYVLIYQSSILQARLLIAKGAIAGLNFKLAATSLKVLALLQWHQIGIFIVTYASAFYIKGSIGEGRKIIKRMRLRGTGDVISKNPLRSHANFPVPSLQAQSPSRSSVVALR